MAEVVSISTLGFFMPILSFLLVFVVVYAILKKSKLLSDSEGILIFVSLIMASFFILNASLVDFIQFSSAWFVALVMVVFLMMVLLAFVPVKDPFSFLGKWFSWALFGILIILFVVSSAYVFNWAVNWSAIWARTGSDWLGFILLVVAAGVVSFVIKGKK